MNKLEKTLLIIAIIFVSFMAFLVYYDSKTACPNIAIYVKCNNFLE
jgi:hypothetical protein